MPSLAELKDPKKYHHFTKKLLPSGTFSVPTVGPNGEKKDAKGNPIMRDVDIPEARLDRWINNHNRMIANGRIPPMPLRHDLKALPIPLREGEPDAKDTNGVENAGFWLDLRKVELDGKPDDKGIVKKEMWLEGVAAVPVGTKWEKDVIGKSITDASPLAQAKWIDGDKNEYDDVVTHIAATTHTIVGSQPNFESTSEYIALSLDMLSSPLPQKDKGTTVHPFISLAMDGGGAGTNPVTVGSSDKNVAGGLGLPTNAANASVKDAVAVLKSCGLALPEDTSAENLCQFIVVAGNALLANRQQKGDGPESVKDQPKGSQDQPKGVALSMAGIEYDALPDSTKAIIQSAGKAGRNSYINRINACVASGQITPAFAKETLSPKMDNLALSFDAEGRAVNSEFDAFLTMIESLPKGTVLTGQNATGLKGGSRKGSNHDMFAIGRVGDVKNPEQEEAIPETEEEADAVVDLLFNQTGRGHLVPSRK